MLCRRLRGEANAVKIAMADGRAIKRGEPVLPNFWARKSTADLMQEAARAAADPEGHSFKRSLSAFNLVMLGIGGVIGAGIFILTGQAAATNAGPAVTLSFLLGAVPAPLPACVTPKWPPAFRSAAAPILTPMRRSAS